MVKKIWIVLIGIMLIIGLFVTGRYVFSIITLGENIQFAGYIWDITVEGNLRQCGDDPIRHPQSCSTAGGSYEKSHEGFMIINGYANSGVYYVRAGYCMPNSDSQVCMTTKEDITDIDEFLIIWSGSVEGSGISVDIYDKSTGDKKSIQSARPDSRGIIDPQLIKYLNNFDGTYTAYTTLGIGDIYIKSNTIDVSDFQSRHLQICINSGAHCTWGRGGEHIEGTIKIYNIITKRLEAPICKAGQVPLPNGSCENLEYILLAHESAIYESLQEKIVRMEARLKAREEGLEKRIVDFQEFLSIATKEEKLIWIDNKLIELNNEKIEVELQHQQDITSLINSIDSMEEELMGADPNRIKYLEERLIGANSQLSYLQSLDPSKSIQDQIDFYESQKILLETGVEAKVTYLETEFLLTKQILDNIQSGLLIPPPDVDIEEIIKKVLDKIELEVISTGRDLTDEEIKVLVDSEINIQFQERFPEGLHRDLVIIEKIPLYFWYIIGSLAGLIIIIFTILFIKRK